MERHIKIKIGFLIAFCLIGVFLLGSTGVLAEDKNDVVITNFHSYNSQISAFFGQLFSGQFLSISATPSVVKAGDLVRYDWAIPVDKSKCSLSTGGAYIFKWFVVFPNGGTEESHTAFGDGQCSLIYSGTASFRIGTGIPTGTYTIETYAYDKNGRDITNVAANTIGSLQVTSGGGGKPDCPTTCSDWSACTLQYNNYYTKNRNCWVYVSATNNCQYENQMEQCNAPPPSPTCQNDPYCFAENMFQCSGTNTYQLCHKGSDGCFHWSSNTNCLTGQECSYEHLQCEATTPQPPTTITCTHCDGSTYPYQGDICPDENCGGGGGNVTLTTCQYCNGTFFQTPAVVCPTEAELGCGIAPTTFDLVDWINANLYLFIAIVAIAFVAIAVLFGYLAGGKRRRRRR